MLSLLAAIDGQQIIQAVVWLIVVGLIFWLLNWLIGYVALGEPFTKIARVLLAVFAVVLVIYLLMGFIGSPVEHWGR